MYQRTALWQNAEMVYMYFAQASKILLMRPMQFGCFCLGYIIEMKNES